MPRRFQFSLRRLLIVIALLCAAFELGNLSLHPWGPCGAVGEPLPTETVIAGCGLSYAMCLICAIALRPPRNRADFLDVTTVVLAMSVLAVNLLFAKLVHDTHGSRAMVLRPLTEAD